MSDSEEKKVRNADTITILFKLVFIATCRGHSVVCPFVLFKKVLFLHHGCFWEGINYENAWLKKSFITDLKFFVK